MKKVSKQREYAAMLRSQHSTMKKQERNYTQLAVKPQHIKEAEIKRQAVSKPQQGGFCMYITVHLLLIIY